MDVRKKTDHCRFCGQGAVKLIYPPTNNTGSLKAGEFSCTNCGFGMHGPIVKCDLCGMIYSNENLSQERISTYYEVSQDPLYFAEQEARRKTFEIYLSKLEKIYPERGKLLDVGTNTGLFVKIARDRGWNARGLEPNRWAVEFALKNYQIDLINKPFASGVFPENSFDVITMWDVIEHFADPVAELKKVCRYLKSGGVLAFSTVDPESPLARFMGSKWPWYMEMHRVFLSRRTADSYLQRIGFSKVIFRPHWRRLSLGYLASRLKAINKKLAAVAQGAIKTFGLPRLIVPYYANDLYDCYAFKD